jgi:hypothetical protein
MMGMMRRRETKSLEQMKDGKHGVGLRGRVVREPRQRRAGSRGWERGVVRGRRGIRLRNQLLGGTKGRVLVGRNQLQRRRRRSEV